MNSRTRAIVAVALGCFCGQACGEGKADKAWRELFARPDPAAETARIDAVLAACEDDVGKLKSLIASDAVYEAYKGGWHRRTLKVGEGKAAREVVFSVRVPRDYSPARSYPLLLAAHGQNRSGEGIGRSMEILMGDAVERYILVAPTLPDKQRGFVATDLQEQGYLGPLAWARVNLNVDDDRIYVCGYGQGGYVGWHLAVMYPHLFAAAVPIAGMPYFRGAPYTITCYLENLDHLPVWAVWGEKDLGRPADIGNARACRMAAARLRELDNANFKPTELPGAGHYACWPKGSEFVSFLSSGRRRSAPATLRHFFHQRRHARGYYVEAVALGGEPIDFTRRIRVELPLRGGEAPTRDEALDAGSRYFARRLFKLRAEMDASKNLLVIRPLGVTGVRVYVVDGLFDLSAPAEVRCARAAWKGRIPVSPRCILLHYAATRDATALVYNEIDLDIQGKASARYKK